MVSCSAWWDPAFGSAKGDASVFALVFIDEEGQYYIHHIDYIRISERSKEDEATQQCKKIAALLSQFYVPSITIEINGIGRFLPSILRREIRASNHIANVVEYSNRTPKSQRILESFDAIMAAKHLWVNQAILLTPFINEMREWRPASKNGRDDGLDAVAGALSQQSIRISGGPQKGTRKNWSPNTTIFQAKT